MERGKKSQISIFIIIGILIIVSIAIIFTLRQNPSNTESKDTKILSFVDNCIRVAAEESIYQIGQSGGYYSAPKPSTDHNLPYYFYEGKDYSISKEELEEELSKFMNDNIFFCTKNFIDFPEYKIEQGEIKTTTKIDNNKILFNINYPISVSKEKKTFFYETFSYETNSRLGLIYKSIKELLIEQKNEKNYLCISCLGEITDKYDLYAELFDHKDSMIIKLIDKNTKVKEEDYAFYFAIKYE